MNSQEVQLTPRQAEDLERIARNHQTEPEELVRLAVEALITEVNRDGAWLAEVRANASSI